MVDNYNPTNQFHPYQPVDAIPQSGASSGGLGGMLKKFGLGSNPNLRGSIDRARGMAQANPGAVLGGLAALVIGAGLMRRRGMR